MNTSFVYVNVTTSMDDETLTWVSAEAERAGRSVPSWIAARLKQPVSGEATWKQLE